MGGWGRYCGPVVVGNKVGHEQVGRKGLHVAHGPTPSRDCTRLVGAHSRSVLFLLPIWLQNWTGAALVGWEMLTTAT